MWVIAGLLGKVVGCSLGGLMSKNSMRDSLKIGVGMMARAEVVIVCASKGIENSLISPMIMPFTLLLILLSSFITPMILKLLYKNELGDKKSVKEEK